MSRHSARALGPLAVVIAVGGARVRARRLGVRGERAAREVLAAAGRARAGQPRRGRLQGGGGGRRRAAAAADRRQRRGDDRAARRWRPGRRARRRTRPATAQGDRRATSASPRCRRCRSTLPDPDFSAVDAITTPVGTRRPAARARGADPAARAARARPAARAGRARGGDRALRERRPALLRPLRRSPRSLVNGLELGLDKASTEIVRLIDSQTIDPSDIDVSKIIAPARRDLGALQAVIQPILNTLPDITVPATLARVRVTPNERIASGTRLTQRARTPRSRSPGSGWPTWWRRGDGRPDDVELRRRGRPRARSARCAGSC